MAGGKNRRVKIRPRADHDITEHAQYIARDNVEAGLRFYEATEGISKHWPISPKWVLSVSTGTLA